jgi:hypothetical protein
MLHGVSWVQFLAFLGIGLVIYYLVVGIQFFGNTVGDKMSGKRTAGRTPEKDGSVGLAGESAAAGGLRSPQGSGLPGGSGTSASPGKVEERDNGTREAGRGGAVRTVMPEEDGQPSLFRAEPKGQGETAELFKVMEKVIGLLKEVMSQGVAQHPTREELTDRIREVLGKYGQLKRTPYQVAVNNYIIRVCSSQFALVLDEDALDRLWG